MPTSKLNLPTIDNTKTADVVRDMNALAEAVDAVSGASGGLATLGPDGKVPSAQLNISAPADATTSTKGVVMLEDSTTSTSVTKAATPNAVKVAKEALANQIGTLTSLNTTAKTNLVAAVNELFTSASNGKTQIASAITGKGVAANGSDTFPALATKIGQITTGINGESIKSVIASETITAGDRVTTEVFSKLPNPAITPSGGTYGIDCSAGGTYTAVIYNSTTSPVIYKKAGDVFTKLSNVSTNPSGVAGGVSVSPDGMYMAVAHSTTPFISIYKNNNDVFEKLPDPAVIPTATGTCCAFSPDGNYLAVGSVDGLWLYKRSGDSFTRTSSPSSRSIRDVGFSLDSSVLIVGATTSSISYFLYYTVNADGSLASQSTTGISHPSNTNAVNAVAISPDKQYVAICYTVSPFISVYKYSGGTFSPLTISNAAITGTVSTCYFSADGNYLIFGYTSGINIFSRNGDTFTKIANPTSTPANRVYGIAGTSDSKYTFVSTLDSPYFIVYKKYGAAMKNYGTQMPGTAIGYAKTGGTIGSTISIGVLFE